MPMAASPSGKAMSDQVAGTMATLAVDSRCELGECILWCERRLTLYWTDILSGRLWAHIPDTGATLHWDLPQPLGCFALCSDGQLLLGLAKGLFLTDPQGAPDTALVLRHVADVESERSDTRINDGRSDRHGATDVSGCSPGFGLTKREPA
jgi:sugar lactone lactonase YvrE